MRITVTIFIIIVMCLYNINFIHAGINGENNPALLAAMYDNPENYIYYGGQSTGVSFYIEKSSIRVEEYNPPFYIISMNTVYYASNGMLPPHFKDMARYIGNVRYFYDYKNKMMYEHKFDGKGNEIWNYVESRDFDSVEAYKSGRKSTLSAGEIGFFILYGKSFYSKPLFIRDTVENGVALKCFLH